jgi:hypothetical protein
MPESKKKKEKKKSLEPGVMSTVKKTVVADEQKTETDEKKINPRDKKEIEKELLEIYKDQNGEMPDMTKIYHKKRSRAKTILVGFVVFFAFLTALSWIGFFFFGRGGSFSGEKVNLEIIAPASLGGGEMIEYVIKYKNEEKVPLGQGEIEVRFPENFVLTEVAPPSSERENLWKIGSLAAGEKGEIKIKGVLYGALETLGTVQAVLTYKPADFSSEFQKVATAVTKIDHSALDISLSGPERILAQSETTFKIKYKNTAASAMQNVKVAVIAPSDFSFKKEGDEKEMTSWNLSEVAANGEGEIEFAGSFGEAVEGERELKVQIGFAKGDDFFLQRENIFKANVIRGSALLTLIANGDSGDRTINFGATLNYAIVYQNKDKVELEDLEIKMVFDSTSRNNKTLLDWTALKDDADGIILGTQISPELRKGAITWTKRQISELARLAPGAEGTINFQIKMKQFSDVEDWDIKDFEVKSLATIKIGKIGGEAKEETVESNPITLKVNTNLVLKTQARYFNDDNIAVGSGPLPPKVGETTAYRIFWKVTNSLHEVENLKVSTVLPENVIWSNKFEIEAGEIKFDETTREVAWTLNRLPLDVGEIGVNFEVTVTPTETDKGKLLTLLLNTNLQATDKSTGGTISKTDDALTSNLDGDPMAEGKGVVK